MEKLNLQQSSNVRYHPNMLILCSKTHLHYITLSMLICLMLNFWVETVKDFFQDYLMNGKFSPIDS